MTKQASRGDFEQTQPPPVIAGRIMLVLRSRHSSIRVLRGCPQPVGVSATKNDHHCAPSLFTTDILTLSRPQLLDSMWQDTEGAKPNKRTYDLVIQACGHGGEWELGVTLIDDMRDLGIKPDAQTFNIAVAACARSGERLAAETLVANMLKAGVTPDEFTYASLVAA